MTADEKPTLPLIVRLTPPLTDFFATLTLSFATKRETTTLRTASLDEPSWSVTTMRSA